MRDSRTDVDGTPGSPDSPAAPSPASSPGSRRSIRRAIAIPLAAALVLGGVFAVGRAQLRRRYHAAPTANAAAKGAPQDSPGPTVGMDGVVVQLSSAVTDCYLRFGLVLELEDQRSKDTVEKAMARVRAAVVEALRDLTPDDVRGGEGFALTKASIRKRMRRVVGPGLREIYLTEFTIL